MLIRGMGLSKGGGALVPACDHRSALARRTIAVSEVAGECRRLDVALGRADRRSMTPRSPGWRPATRHDVEEGRAEMERGLGVPAKAFAFPIPPRFRQRTTSTSSSRATEVFRLLDLGGDTVSAPLSAANLAERHPPRSTGARRLAQWAMEHGTVAEIGALLNDRQAPPEATATFHCDEHG